MSAETTTFTGQPVLHGDGLTSLLDQALDAEGGLLEEIAGPDAEGRELLIRAAERFGLSARGYHRVLRVARTIADLDESADVRRGHVAEALSFRLTTPVAA